MLKIPNRIEMNYFPKNNLGKIFVIQKHKLVDCVCLNYLGYAKNIIVFKRIFCNIIFLIKIQKSASVKEGIHNFFAQLSVLLIIF